MRSFGLNLMLLALLPASLNAQTPYADRVEIRRTALGVPHIEADDMGAFGYAMAWVQLEDYGARVSHGLIRAWASWPRFRTGLGGSRLHRATHPCPCGGHVAAVAA